MGTLALHTLIIIFLFILLSLDIVIFKIVNTPLITKYFLEAVFKIYTILIFYPKYLFYKKAFSCFQSNQQMVDLKILQDIYNQNKNILNSETKRLESTNSSYTNLKDLFSNNVELSSHTHISWRITKMATARVIRQVFPKPFFLPERSGQSVERFLMIDGAKAEPYVLPNTECSYVFVIQASGERSIVLKPSKECSNSCKTISIVLKPSYVCK